MSEIRLVKKNKEKPANIKLKVKETTVRRINDVNEKYVNDFVTAVNAGADKRGAKLDERANNIRDYMNFNSSRLDSDTKKTLEDILGAYDSKYKNGTPRPDQERFDYGFALHEAEKREVEAYEVALREQFGGKTLAEKVVEGNKYGNPSFLTEISSGKTTDMVRPITKISTTESKFDESEWEKYLSFSQRPDFKKNSKPVSTAKNLTDKELKEKGYTQSEDGNWFTFGLGGVSWYQPNEDMIHEYINASEDERNRMFDEENVERGASAGVLYSDRVATSKYSTYGQMTEDEVALYNYIYNTSGKDAAEEMLAVLKPELDRRFLEGEKVRLEEMGRENPVAASVFSVGTNLQAALLAPGQLAAAAVGKDDAWLDNAAMTTTALRGGAGERASELNVNVPLIDKNLGELLYGSVMSIADMGAASLLGAGIGGGGKAAARITQAIMSSSAASNAVYSAHERGLNGIEVTTRGVLAGAIEWATEKYSIESLFSDGSKGIIIDALKQMGIEASEETASSVLNTVADEIIANITGNASEIDDLTNRYVTEEGLSYEDARRRAIIETVQEVGADALAGALSGGVMGAGKGVAYKAGLKANRATEPETKAEPNEVIELDTETLPVGEIGEVSVGAGKAGAYEVQLTEAEGEVKTVDVDSLSRNSPEYKILRAAEDSHMTPAVADAVLRGYNGSVPVNDYVAEAEYVSAAAKAGTAYEAILKGSDTLSEDVRRAIWEDGRAYSENITKARQTFLDEVKAKSEGKVMSGRFDTKDIKGMKLNRTQERAVKTAEALSSLGFNIRMVKSIGGDSRKLGYYDKRTGDIVVSVNARSRNIAGAIKSQILPTMAHEITHSFRATSPELYSQYRETVLGALYGSGELQRLVENEFARLRDSGRYAEATDAEIYDAAYDELVARASEDMLADPAAIEKICRENRTVGEKILDAIDGFISTLKSILKGEPEESVHEEARILRGMLKEYEAARELWVKALADSAETRAALSEAGDVVREDGTPVATGFDSGEIQLNEATYEEEGRAKLAKYLNGQVKGKKLSRADADDILNSLDGIYNTMKTFAGKYAPYAKWAKATVIRDGKGKPVFSVVTPNGDYSMNIDFSLVCKKRRMLDAVFNRMIERGLIDDFSLGKEEIVKINNIIKDHKFEIACALCFVDAKRFRQAGVADSFVEIYNGIVNEITPDGVEVPYFNFGGNKTLNTEGKGLDGVKVDNSVFQRYINEYGEKSVEGKVAKHLRDHPSDRKLLHRGDFISTAGFDAVKRQNPDILSLFNSKKGSGGPKSAFSDTQYLNEIIASRTFNAAKAFAVGGVRVQSFSDYIPRLVFDYCQMVGDLAAKRLPAHAYSKEDLFVKQFGKTGIKINMSLIPKIVDGGVAPGLDADGNYAWADESFDFDTAKEIQNADGYTDNCGTICVGVSREHILKLLGDPDIRMVIPYHKSGLNPIVAQMNKIAEFKDYTNAQNTRYTNEDGTPGSKLSDEDVKSQPNVNALMQKGMTAKEAAQAYLDWCDQKGYTPKFDEFAGNENYYKLLIDFVCYNKNGDFVPQGAVKMNFPNAEDKFGSMAKLIESGLEADAVTQFAQDEALDPIVDEIEQVLGDGDVLYSEYDEIIDKSIKRFGTTEDFAEAGFFLPDGRMLRLTDDSHRGERQYDHRAIGIAYGVDVDLGVNHGYNAESNKHLDDFVNKGGIRFDPGSIEFNHDAMLQLSKNTPITREQEQTIRDFLEWKKQQEEMYNPDDYEWSLYDGPLGLRIDFGDTSNVRISADRGALGIDSLSYEGGQINADRIINDIRHYYRTGETRQASVVSQFHYNEALDDDLTMREVLTGALEGTALTEADAKVLERYRRRVREIDGYDERLREVNREIKEISFAKGKRDAARLSELKSEKAKLEQDLKRADRKLLELSSTEALKNLFDREAKRLRREKSEALRAATKEARRMSDAQLKEVVEKERERGAAAKAGERMAAEAEIAELRRRTAERELKDRTRRERLDVEKRIRRVISYVTSQTDDKNVKQGLRGVVADFAHAILSNNAAYTQSEMTRMRERYEEIAKAGEGVEFIHRGAYDFDIQAELDSLNANLKGRAWRDLTISELETVDRVTRNLMHMIRLENKIFRNGKGESRVKIGEACERAIAECASRRGEKTTPKGKVGQAVQRFGEAVDGLIVTGNLMPVYYFDILGGEFEVLYNDLVDGQNKWSRIVEDSTRKADEIKEKYDFNKLTKGETVFTTDEGVSFEMTVREAMYFYAAFKRETLRGDTEHYLRGGIASDKIVSKAKGDSVKRYRSGTVRLSGDDAAMILDSLSTEQKAFADELVAYLSTDIARYGNETSMDLYGIEKFGDEYYIPYRVSGDAVLKDPIEAAEPDKGKGGGEAKIKHTGMTNAIKHGAGNAMEQADIMEVFTKHCVEMANYAAFAVPIENIGGVLNFRGTDGELLRAEMRQKLGDNMTSYFDTFIRDMNGGVKTTASGIEKFLSLQKKASVAASLSTVVQQPTAMFRAMAMIDPKYFVTVKGGETMKGIRASWDEMKQYAPGVTVVKDMGKFDVGSGVSAAEYISGDMTFGKAVDKGAGFLAEWADKLTWIHIWKACKAEAKAKGLRGEELLTSAGKRFTDVINRTQVYDSTLVRSENMRSRNALMKPFTAFKAEPTVTLNVMADAVRSKSPAKIARTASALLVSTIVNNALRALVYAGRDDDEEKGYFEKYGVEFSEGLVEDMMLWNYVPFVSDLASITRGFKSKRMETQLFESVYNSFNALWEEDAGWREWATFVGDVGNFAGLPVKNVIRDFVMMPMNIANSSENSLQGAWYAAVDAIAGSTTGKNLEKIGIDITNTDYDGYIEALENGDGEEAEKIFGAIVEYKMFKARRKAEAKGEEFYEDEARKNAESSVRGKITEHLDSSYDGYLKALDSGDTKGAAKLYEDITGLLVSYERVRCEARGEKFNEKKAKASAESSLQSRVTKHFKKRYVAADYDERTAIRQILRSTGLYDNVRSATKAWVTESLKEDE